MNVSELLAKKRQELKETEANIFKTQGATMAFANGVPVLRKRLRSAIQAKQAEELEAQWGDALKSASGNVGEATRSMILASIDAMAREFEMLAGAQAKEATKAEGRRDALLSVIDELSGVNQAPETTEGEPDAGPGAGDDTQQ